MEHFPLISWITLHNRLERYAIRRHESGTSLLYILVEQGTIHLIRTEAPRSQSINTKGGRYHYPVILAAVNGDQQILEVLLHHNADVNVRGSECRDAFSAAIAKGHFKAAELLVRHGASLNASHTHSYKTFRVAVKQGSVQTSKMLLKNSASFNLKSDSKDSNDLLETAMNTGDGEFVKLLFQHGYVPDLQKFQTFYLVSALEEGNMEIVEALVQCCVDMNRLEDANLWNTGLKPVQGFTTCSIDLVAQSSKQTVFRCASSQGHEGLVRLLLFQNTDAYARDYDQNALVHASIGGYEAAVHMLLSHGANPNAFGGGKWVSPLYAAASSNRSEVMRLLLENGADVNASGGEYGSALQAASCTGSEVNVRILLDNGAGVNASGGFYGSALQAASYQASETIVRILLNNGAVVNAYGGRYGSALQAASDRGNEAIVRVLLENGADVNASGGTYGSALQAASHRGSEAIVRMLLRNGADVNASGGAYGSALHAAVRGGLETFIPLLLEHGADVNRPSHCYQNALEAARSCRPRSKTNGLVKLLLKRGATLTEEQANSDWWKSMLARIASEEEAI